MENPSHQHSSACDCKVSYPTGAIQAPIPDMQISDSKLLDSLYKEYLLDEPNQAYYDGYLDNGDSFSSSSTDSVPTPTGSESGSRSSSRARATDSDESAPREDAQTMNEQLHDCIYDDQLSSMIEEQRLLQAKVQKALDEPKGSGMRIPESSGAEIQQDPVLLAPESTSTLEPVVEEARRLELENLSIKQTKTAELLGDLLIHLEDFESSSPAQLAAFQERFQECEDSIRTQQVDAAEKKQVAIEKLKAVMREKVVPMIVNFDKRVGELEKELKSQQNPDASGSASASKVSSLEARIEELEARLQNHETTAAAREEDIARRLTAAEDLASRKELDPVERLARLLEENKPDRLAREETAQEARIVELEKEVESQKKLLAGKEGELRLVETIYCKEMEAMMGRIAELEGSLRSQEVAAAAKERVHTHRLRSAESLSSSRLLDKTALEARFAELEEEFESQQRELFKKGGELASLYDQTQMMCKEEAAMREKIAELEEEVEDFTSQLCSAETTYSREKEAMREKIAELERSLETQKASSASTEKSLITELEQAMRVSSSLESKIRDMEELERTNLELTNKLAEYERITKPWKQSQVSQDELVKVTDNVLYKYLTSAPIDGQIRAVKFIISSHDQGWSIHPDDKGTYDNSWTWFEVAIISPNGQPITVLGNRVICRNRHAISRTEKKTLIFEIPGLVRTGANILKQGEPAPKVRPWVENLVPGSRVALMASGKDSGWVNTVESAEIIVYTAPE